MEEAALKVRGLVRTYGARRAVDGLDLDVPPGCVFGFLGPNGAGKTTAMRCILGLIPADAGEVTIFGEKDPVAQRRHVGALVETPAFYGWLSGRANLEIACAYAGIDPKGGAVEEALERVGLRERAEDKAGGYSLGMKQRLGIAQAILGRPRLLMLDEPTNGLDPQGMRDIRELLAALARDLGITVFVSSHLLWEIQALSDQVGIILNGRLVAQGKVSELLAGGDLIEVEVGCPDAAQLREVAGRIPGVAVSGEGENRRTVLTLDGIEPAALNKALVEGGVPVSELVIRGRTLEDLFLSLTGHVGIT